MQRSRTYTEESLSYSPWVKSSGPEKILIIRFHALGDVAITLPTCTALREKWRDTRIDFITSGPCAGLLNALEIFDNVYIFRQSNDRRARFAEAIRRGFDSQRTKYDVIIDLQRNWVSRLIRRVAMPKSWGEFNRFAPRPAGDRVLETFHKIGLTDLVPSYQMRIKGETREAARNILMDYGWDGEGRLVVLNPAGLWETRNWPLANYVELAGFWSEHEQVKFLFLGTDRLFGKARYLTEQLGDSAVNLVNKTSLGEALAILQFVSVAVSEDSGLMHMAWVSGVPTVALLGSSRGDWSRPLGKQSRCLHSGDLPCGACMEAKCRFGDVHCLTRYTPEVVFNVVQELVAESENLVDVT